MATVTNNPNSIEYTSINVGGLYEIPDGYPKWEAYPETTSFAGELGWQLKYMQLGMSDEWGYVDRQFYFGLRPGYDVISNWVGPLGPNFHWDIVVTVTNQDGTLPAHPNPVAVDDYAEVGVDAGYRVKVADIVLNDKSFVADKVLQIDIRPTTAMVDAYLEADPSGSYIQLSAVWGYTNAHTTFTGSTSLEYRVQDVLGQWSSWAKIAIDFLGDNLSRDNIVGGDKTLGEAVNDTIDFSLSNKSVGIHGLGGDDTIRGSQAGDNLNGDDGADRIGGKGGNDIINGGNGNDTLFGDAGNDTIDGGADNDTLWGGDGNDIIRGGLGNDQVYGEAGDDQVGGKAGNDAVHGGAGNDTIWGDEGNDALYGDAGNDNLNGGAGNDFLTGGLGIDRMRGEAGVDTFVFIRGEAQGDTVLDFEGAGIVGGDKIEFRGYGAGATVHQVSGDTWQIDAAGITETFKIAGVTNLSKVDFYFT